MNSIYLPLSMACQKSTEVDMVGQIKCNDNRWVMWNAAGIVIARGEHPLEVAVNYLAPCEVVR